MRLFRRLKFKGVWMPIAFILILALVVSFVRSPPDNTTSLAYSDVLAATHVGTLESVDVRGDQLDVRLRGDATKYTSRVSASTDVARNLQEAAATTVEPSSQVNLVFHDDRPSSWSNWAAFFLQFGVAAIAVYFGAYFAVRRAMERSRGN